jgi:hypothetical protein
MTRMRTDYTDEEGEREEELRMARMKKMGKK